MSALVAFDRFVHSITSTGGGGAGQCPFALSALIVAVRSSSSFHGGIYPVRVKIREVASAQCASVSLRVVSRRSRSSSGVASVVLRHPPPSIAPFFENAIDRLPRARSPLRITRAVAAWASAEGPMGAAAVESNAGTDLSRKW